MADPAFRSYAEKQAAQCPQLENEVAELDSEIQDLMAQRKAKAEHLEHARAMKAEDNVRIVCIQLQNYP